MFYVYVSMFVYVVCVFTYIHTHTVKFSLFVVKILGVGVVVLAKLPHNRLLRQQFQCSYELIVHVCNQLYASTPFLFVIISLEC